MLRHQRLVAGKWKEATEYIILVRPPSYSLRLANKGSCLRQLRNQLIMQL